MLYWINHVFIYLFVYLFDPRVKGISYTYIFFYETFLFIYFLFYIKGNFLHVPPTSFPCTGTSGTRTTG